MIEWAHAQDDCEASLSVVNFSCIFGECIPQHADFAIVLDRVESACK